MPKPRLTIVIPIRNRQELGERALRSAAAQAVLRTEIIIVDDASDPPFQIPADIRSNESIKLVRHPDNLGASSARNTGIASAGADWIAFLDSDDYWLPGTLAPRLENAEAGFAIDRNPLVVHAAGFILESSITRRLETRIPRESSDPLDFASGCWFAPGSTLLVRKEAFDSIGPYDIELRRLEDLDWFLRLALRGGALKVWKKPAALIGFESHFAEVHLTRAVAHLSQKYLTKQSPDRLSGKLACRFRAYMNIERAACCSNQKRWFGVLFYLGRSFLQVPRTALHLAKFWRFEAPPTEIEPAGDVAERVKLGVPTSS
ncbi:glycosyltransferase family 2 protein [Bradyrhizobium sp. WSM2254]|uniref:glycosyltransferase family 2 protein n=1 Tax=Bradyrhizobium sp. WSM2254 TaxID=1188263 RepID=UPI0018DDE5DA|nr:glycosyltransferase family A protein [Bradyrhizobium sp. WSM2254]